jgi:hypothetical protein
MNARWHRQHPMPKRPSEPVGAKWHVAHAKACGWRDIPDSIAALIRRLQHGTANQAEVASHPIMTAAHRIRCG